MAETTTITGIEQGRAKFAYECAYKVVSSKDKQFAKEYKSNVKKLPAMIKTNGVGAAIAFVLSKADKKKGNPYQLIYEQVTAWLQQDSKKLIHLDESSNLAYALVSLKSPQYRAVTTEILSFLNWLKRFADGLIDEGEET